MIGEKQFKKEIAGQEFEVRIGQIANQANSSVIVRQGETTVMVTVCSGSNQHGKDFFPLTVDYEERYYAAGKILGSRFMRREGHPSDEATLTGRLIDRSIRPLFPESFRNEVQVIITVLSFDGINDPDVPGLLGASIALSLSDLPWQGPIAPCRVGYLDNQWKINPSYEQQDQAEVYLTLSAVEGEKEILINMIEAAGQEAAEEKIVEGLTQAEPVLKTLIQFQKEIINQYSPTKIPIPEVDISLEAPVEQSIRKFIQEKLNNIFPVQAEQEVKEVLSQLHQALQDFLNQNHPECLPEGFTILEEELYQFMRQQVLDNDQRLDGRGLKEIRPLQAEVSLIPRVHGSGLFQRGLTKVLSVVTLGPTGDCRKLEGMEVIEERRFMHHYNFPPYSTGEVKPLVGTKRREIGHGYLAEKALSPLIPDVEDFPYTIRLVSECLSSNGSTSMGSVCASSLSLMDAGVPIKAPAAGISVGLVTGPDHYKLLTDVQGAEDHYGDMDFKVAGTKQGVTAMQVDVKIKGLTKQMINEALAQAKEARLAILETMARAIERPRDNLSPWAPKIVSGQINPSKIGMIIGPGGRTINALVDKHGVTIDIEDDGHVYVAGPERQQAQKALDEIMGMTHEAEVGETFEGKVTRIFNFGAMIEFLPGQEGLVHISEFANHRIGQVEDVVKVGDTIPVKVIEIDEKGRINLSAKAAGFQAPQKATGSRPGRTSKS
ncbi:MAG TPA: polyribonucleotide nucleotidyltransferase [Candidatus Pacearchaeota archaeon]|nr:polyribonucleotide nucleotidyltransferase [Candidatus Pacearchaeota archaeon]